MQAAYDHQTLDQPVLIPGLLSGASLATMQEVFPLTEVDFIHLQGGSLLVK